MMMHFFLILSIWIKYNNRFGEIIGVWGQNKCKFSYQNNTEDEKKFPGARRKVWTSSSERSVRVLYMMRKMKGKTYF